MSIEEHVHHAFGNYNGMFLFTNSARQEDFWVFLGPLVGWGRLSLRTNRLPNSAEGAFEFVEIRPATEEPPTPILDISYLFTPDLLVSTLKEEREKNRKEEKLLYPCFYEEQIHMNGCVVETNREFNCALIKFLRGTDFPKEVLDEKEKYIEMETVCDFIAYNAASSGTPLAPNKKG